MSRIFKAFSDGKLCSTGYEMRCALGKGGVIAAEAKREGDHCSPLGLWPMRRVFYRPDRLQAPKTDLEVHALRPFDGWCDDQGRLEYNQLIKTPFAGSHESLWRDDHVYDVVVELGYNDDPIIPGAGSAIFMHVAKPDYSGTEGCVALALPDLLTVLDAASAGSIVDICLA